MAGRNVSVAIIGGGISGLVCAARLGQLGISNVTVFDTGKNAAGGRCSSRDVNINGKIYTLDHSAQYFTVSNPAFAKIVSFLIRKGAVQEWKGPIGHIDRRGTFVRMKESPAYIGTRGMGSIPKCLSTIVNVQRPVWVANVWWEESCKKWKVDKYGYFDYVVIAHNGKCADKLMSQAGAPGIHALLRVRFSATLNPKELKMHLCSLWVLLVAFKQPLKLSFEGAHVDSDVISWVANNTAKLKLSDSYNPALPCRNNVECWTIFSTREFGSRHKVPQEMIPPKKAEEVTQLMLDAFRQAIKIPAGCGEPVFTRVQLWGAALPLNTLDIGDDCVFDATKQVGICGDWLVSPCIQGAAVSGLALAEKINKHTSDRSHGTRLDAKFKATQSAAIGAFPYDANNATSLNSI